MPEQITIPQPEQVKKLPSKEVKMPPTAKAMPEDKVISFSDLVAKEAPKAQLQELQKMEDKDIDYGWAGAVLINRGTKQEPDYVAILTLKDPKKTAFIYEFGNNYQLITKFFESAKSTAAEIQKMAEDKHSAANSDYKKLRLLRQAIKISLEKEMGKNRLEQ